MTRLVEQFLFDLGDHALSSRFNIAPSQPVAALRVLDDDDRPRLSMLRWGLIPSWANDPSIGNRMINARAETVHEKPSFRSAFRRRRCLVLADGYYEWKKLEASGKKQPYYIRMQDDGPFAFAGLWESWQDKSGTPLETCTIVTTAANELTRSLHPRMPVILESYDYDAWLQAGESELDYLRTRLAPYRSDAMIVIPVSTIVNSPRNDTAECIRPIDPPARGSDGSGQLTLL
jgi:putative SOS response-associated peptidase YedK